MISQMNNAAVLEKLAVCPTSCPVCSAPLVMKSAVNSRYIAHFACDSLILKDGVVRASLTNACKYGLWEKMTKEDTFSVVEYYAKLDRSNGAL